MSGINKNITRHTDEIIQLKVPLPFPLRWVNSYLISGENGYTLIDPGINTEEAKEFWGESLKHLHLTMKDIKRIVLTHHHPDHYGLSGWFQEKTQAPVYMSRAGYEQAMRLWGPGEDYIGQMLDLFTRHGMAGQTMENMTDTMDSFVAQVTPHPEVDEIEYDSFMELGSDTYRAIHTPGHAEGHISFYNEEKGVIFCGDHVLPRITPNISVNPLFDANPLHTFLHSLTQVQELKVTQAYPGHIDPFPDYNERSGQLISHHHSRLKMIMEHVEQPLTSFQLCNLLFGDKLTIHQLRFAMGESIAHLEYLRLQKKVGQVETGGHILYQIN